MSHQLSNVADRQSERVVGQRQEGPWPPLDNARHQLAARAASTAPITRRPHASVNTPASTFYTRQHHSHWTVASIRVRLVIIDIVANVGRLVDARRWAGHLRHTQQPITTRSQEAIWSKAVGGRHAAASGFSPGTGGAEPGAMDGSPDTGMERSVLAQQARYHRPTLWRRQEALWQQTQQPCSQCRTGRVQCHQGLVSPHPCQ